MYCFVMRLIVIYMAMNHESWLATLYPRLGAGRSLQIVEFTDVRDDRLYGCSGLNLPASSFRM